MVKDNVNSWLISNSQIYFADSILTRKGSPNMYSLFDLSNLVEAVILAKRVVTLPGEALETETSAFLKKKHVLKQIEIEKDMANIISSLKSTWEQKSITVRNKHHIAEILSDIFPVEYNIAYQAVVNSNEWTNNIYRTPNWSVTKKFTTEDVSGDDYLSGGLSHIYNLHYLFTEHQKSHYKDIEQMMIQTFVRALFYLMIASSRNYNYYPDSIRIPIVSFISHLYSQEVYKKSKEIMLNLDNKLAEKINIIHKELGFGRFEIRVPSAFSLVFKDCNNKEDILTRAVELRNSRNLRKFRHHLAQLEDSARNLSSRFVDRKKQLESVFDSEKYDWESIIVQALPQMSDLDDNPIQEPTMSLIKLISRPVDTFSKIGALKLIKYLKGRNLIYLRNLGKQLTVIKSSQNNIEKIFGTNLSNDDIRILTKLRAYQNNYLQNLGTDESN